jgi:hypothetical protein
MKDRTLDYLNQLTPLTTNSRNQGQQIYKNYRNEGMSDYPHMKDYQKTIGQLQAEKENQLNIPNQYQQKKSALEQAEGEKYNQQKQLSGELYKEYYNLLQQQADKNAKENLAWAQQNASAASVVNPAVQITPTVRSVPSVNKAVISQAKNNTPAIAKWQNAHNQISTKYYGRVTPPAGYSYNPQLGGYYNGNAYWSLSPQYHHTASQLADLIKAHTIFAADYWGGSNGKYPSNSTDAIYYDAGRISANGNQPSYFNWHPRYN